MTCTLNTQVKASTLWSSNSSGHLYNILGLLLLSINLALTTLQPNLFIVVHS